MGIRVILLQLTKKKKKRNKILYKKFDPWYTDLTIRNSPRRRSRPKHAMEVHMSNVRFGLPRSAFDRVIAAALRDGYQLTLEEKSGWTKIQGPAGPPGPRVHVPNRETVRQGDLSGVGAGWEGALPPAAQNGN